ncbi:MAG: FAD-dependent oxidoreductase [Leptospiraceae bacterium]|nr:FAD-dependent oxidoreductase [Leptospiraceae bacterium]MCP5502482.1 FAD-dependent oxidoreductase [Leptospiraceae bacterium]
MKERLAIVGTGIAGLASAHFLQKEYDISCFEKEDYIGGHSNTVDIEEDGINIPVDTGFIVYNEVTYPGLTALFRDLGVETKNSSMSFSVQHLQSNIEFCGSGLNGLFAQRKNLLNPRFWRLLFNINQFNKKAPSFLQEESSYNISIKEYIQREDYHPDLLEYYLIPMSSAVWSTPKELIYEFPAFTLIRFFYNHGFLGLNTQHQWKTVTGGSREYVKKLIHPFKEKIFCNKAVQEVVKTEHNVTLLFADGKQETFDKVILACHANTALKLLKNPSLLQREILSNFAYEKNIATLHTDESLMPKTRLTWSSWNYRVGEKGKAGKWDSSIVYWMNSLQGVSKKKNYFVSINDPGNIPDSKIIRQIEYYHPLFNGKALNAQATLPNLNQEDQIYFCGSYFRYGFHEDALQSAIQLSKTLLGRGAWT